MGKRLKLTTGQTSLFRETETIQIVKEEIQHLEREQVYYSRYWTPEQMAANAKKIKEGKETLAMLEG